MFANDRGWVRRMHEAIRNGLTAEAAVEKVQSDTRARMLRQTDPFLRDRLHDFDDLANRLLRVLMNKPHGPAGEELPRDAIIVARNMGAAELLDYDREHIRGLVLEEGAPTSHVTIVARALGIPAVGRADSGVALVDNGDAVIVDGIAGEVHLRPNADVEAAYAEKVRFRAKRQEQYQLLRGAAGGHHRRAARQAADERRPARRPAASGRIGRGGHRPVPHRAAVHGRRDDAAHARSRRRSTARCSTPPATSR